MTSSPTELAWAAGLIDGEGCIYIRKLRGGARDRHVLAVRVNMVHLPTIQRLQSVFGHGTVRARKENAPAHHRQKWVWVAVSNGAVEVVRAIRPYMTTKAAEADLALEFASTIADTKGCRLPDDVWERREQLFQSIQAAKRYEYRAES